MRIEMDDKRYFLENIEYKGSKYAGNCTFRAIGRDNPFSDTRITFHADFSLLIDSHIRALESDIDRLAEENKKLKEEKPKHYTGYFRDAAAHGIETLEKAAVAMFSEKEYELSEFKKENEELRLRLRGMQAKIDQFGKSTSDLKAKFIGEYYEEIEETDPETDEEHIRKIPVSWTTTKQIFKEMCGYIKNRKDEDIRP